MKTNAECPDKASLVTLLYGEEQKTEERRRLEGHLLVCQACAAELDELRGVRGALAQWTTPEVPLGFRVVREFTPTPTRRWWAVGSLAAAAVLVLACAAALANLEVHVSANGLTMRTGWDRSGEAPTRPAGAATGANVTNGSAAPWRADLASLEEELRREFAAMPVSASSSKKSSSGRATSDEQVATERMSAELLRRVRTLIERSEARQQEQMAQQISDLAAQFQYQRREDLVRITQELNRLETQRGMDQRILNNFVRVVSAQRSVP